MLNNSFNRVVRCTPNCKNVMPSSNDWEAKYDVSLSILQSEYSQCLLSIQGVDEKANKYLVIISITLTGFFVIISSNATDNLQFNYLYPSIVFSLTIVFVTFVFISFVFGFVIFKDLLNCLQLKSAKKLPDICESLESTKTESVAAYKDFLITAYQDSINSMYTTLDTKQKHLIAISANIKYFQVFLFFSLIILISIKMKG